MAKKQEIIGDQGAIGQMSGPWIFILCVLIVCAAMGSAVYYVFGASPDVIGERVRYRLVMIMLIFALTTVLSMIFAAKAEIKGNWMGFGILVGGPAAFWLISVLLIFRALPDDIIRDKMDLEDLNIRLDAAQQQLGWRGVAGWRASIGEFRSLFLDNEENGVDLLTELSNALYRPRPDPHYLPATPEIYTLIIYNQHSTLKLQRIHGAKAVREAIIPFRSRGTNAAAKIRSLLFVGGYDKGKLSNIHEVVSSDRKRGDTSLGELRKHFHRVRAGYHDFFIVTHYSDGPIDGKADYLLTDVPSFSADGNARLFVGLIGAKGISFDPKRIAVWAVTPPLQLSETTRPRERLLFTKVRVVPDTSENGPNAMSTIVDKVGEWLDLLVTQYPDVMGTECVGDDETANKKDLESFVIDGGDDADRASRGVSSTERRVQEAYCWFYSVTKNAAMDVRSGLMGGDNERIALAVDDASHLVLLMLQMPEPKSVRLNASRNVGTESNDNL